MLRKLRTLGKLTFSFLIGSIMMFTLMTLTKEWNAISETVRLWSADFVSVGMMYLMYYIVLPGTARGVKGFFTYLVAKPYEATLLGTGTSTVFIGVGAILFIR